MSITIEELKDAFHKLLSYIYFDKSTKSVDFFIHPPQTHCLKHYPGEYWSVSSAMSENRQ